MEHFAIAIPYTLYAIVAITILCTVGSITSRILHFNFAYLSILSYLIYILLGYFISSKSTLSTALLASLVVGFYDATVCWNLCIKLKANMGLEAEQIKNLNTSKTLTIMLFMAPFFAFIGYLFK